MREMLGIAAATAVVAVAAGFGAGFAVGWASKDTGSSGGEGGISGQFSPPGCTLLQPGARVRDPRYKLVTIGGKNYQCPR